MVYLPTHTYCACVTPLWIESIDHMHTEQFHRPESQFWTTCFLTINLKKLNANSTQNSLGNGIKCNL